MTFVGSGLLPNSPNTENVSQITYYQRQETEQIQ